jgi:hypothetical protein
MNMSHYGAISPATSGIWNASMDPSLKGIQALSADSSAAAAIGKAQPLTYEQLRVFFINTVLAGRAESGARGKPDGWGGGQTNINLAKISKIKRGGVEIPDPTKVGPLFGYLKDILVENGAIIIAAELTKVAAWYWNNVEKPSLPATIVKASPGASPSKPPARYNQSSTLEKFMGEGKPFYKKPIVWVGTGLTTLIAILLLSKKKK